MKEFLSMLFGVVLGTVVFGFLVPSIYSTGKVDRTFAYACGYFHGEQEIMVRMHVPFDGTLPFSDCDKFKETVRTNGFNPKPAAHAKDTTP